MSERIKDLNFVNMARAIVKAAIDEGREAQLIDCLLDGGSATIDFGSKKLTLVSAAELQKLQDYLK